MPQADAAVVADAVSLLFDPKPKMAERPKDRHRAAWWAQMMETPECREIRAQTVCSPVLSRLGAAEITRGWLSYVQDEPGEPEGDEPGEESIGASVARMRATRAAAKAAQETVRNASNAAAGLGLAEELSEEALSTVLQRMQRSPRLQAILEQAGRYIGRAMSLQRERVDAVRAEITGIELAGDVARLLPSEAAGIAGAVPEMELLALYRLATQRTLCYRHSKRDPVGRGPIVVSVDESGSMSGARIEAAKGLALAMAWIARAQGRPCRLVGFASTFEIWTADGGDPEALIQWGLRFQGGGTSFEGPLRTLPTRAWPEGDAGARADHILITDGQAHPPAELVDFYRAWTREKGVRTWAFLIDVPDAGGAAEVADRAYCVPDLSLERVEIERILALGERA